MGVETKNIIGLDNDRYDNRAADRPHYNTTPYSAAKPRKLSDVLLLCAALFCLPFALVLAYNAWRVFDWVADASSYTSESDPGFVYALKLVFIVCIALILISFALLSVAALSNRFIIRLQNNMPISLFSLIFGGQAMRDLVSASLHAYYSERHTLWENSRYWALETLDLSGKDHAPAVISSDAIRDPLPALPAGSDLIARTLHQRGYYGRSGQSLLVGFSESASPHYIELADTGFIAVAGYPRSGKTSTAAMLAAQIALIPGAEIYIADKHAKRHDSLTKRLEPLSASITAYADTIDTISVLLDRWYTAGRDRLTIETRDQFPTIFLIIDEFTGMILQDELTEKQLRRLLAGSIEFPKVQVHGMYMAHQLTGRLLGGTLGASLRRVTSQRIIQTIDPQDADFFLQDRKLSKHAASLQKGHAWYMGIAQPRPVEVTIPYFTGDDLRYVAGVVSGGTPRLVADVADVATASQRANDVLPEPNESVVSDASTSDKYTVNQARYLLQRQYSDGRYKYSIRDVQSMTNLRTATIIELAHALGRKRSTGE